MEALEAKLYTSLPKDFVKPVAPARPQDVETFVRELLPTNTEGQSNYGKKVANKVLILDNTGNTKEVQPKEGKYNGKLKKKLKNRKVMTSKEKRNKKIFHVTQGEVSYNAFLPLHHLWKEYIKDVLGTNTHDVGGSLIKADLHGAQITVIRSRCPAYIGTTGLIVQETKHLFKLVTETNRLKVIPKKHSIFSFNVQSKVQEITVEIYGSQFCYTPSFRSARKFKYKGSIEL